MLLPFRDHNPSTKRPYVTYGLIASNSLLFLWYWPLFNDPQLLWEFFLEWGLVPAFATAEWRVVGLASSMFLHGGIVHLLGNMLTLYIYGDNLESRFGHGWFLLFYLACGLVSAIAHVIVNPQSFIPTVGASGAIAGVMGGYLLLYPRARIDILLFLVIYFRVITLNAGIVLGFWILVQIYGVATAGESSGIAYVAHVTGFVAGLVMTLPVRLLSGSTGSPKNPNGSGGNRSDRSASLTRPPVIRRRRDF